jgi:hypothetical protein
VGDAGGHDGSDSGLSVADESPDLPPSSYRGPGCQSSSVSHRVSCAAGNLDTPRNRGAADRALANARPVSPPASYLKGHQVTKCPCSWLGPTSSGSFTPATFRGPAAIRHPWRGAALAASMPLGPLRATCVQPAPKSRFVASGVIAHLEAKSKANAAFDFYAIPVGDAGGHDGTGRDSDEAADQLQMSRLTYPHVRPRPELSHSSHRVPCAAGVRQPVPLCSPTKKRGSRLLIRFPFCSRDSSPPF